VVNKSFKLGLVFVSAFLTYEKKVHFFQSTFNVGGIFWCSWGNKKMQIVMSFLEQWCLCHHNRDDKGFAAGTFFQNLSDMQYIYD
jgi:hypothetical protein